MNPENPPVPPTADACLLLADGTVFYGEGIGAADGCYGEICFNTAMSGYQEVLTDPSYCGQIIVFTFPHIGNVGCNDEDIEAHPSAALPASEMRCAGASGLVLRERITAPSSFRSRMHFNEWLKASGIGGISGIDTRALTRHIRKAGAQNAAIFALREGDFRIQAQEALERIKALPDMKGRELAAGISTKSPYQWTQGLWRPAAESQIANPESCHVVAVDFGEKLNILRSLYERGCKVTVVPARSTAEDILRLKPDGVFLSNGPGDPAATAEYAVPELRKLIDSDMPIFGICLGHQLLGRAFGGTTAKMCQGHRGANHPVKNLERGTVEITSQNHGFAVLAESLPEHVKVTHVSLFDGCLEGMRHSNKPVFSVQYHPESSPGPHDSHYLFDEFMAMMEKGKSAV